MKRWIAIVGLVVLTFTSLTASVRAASDDWCQLTTSAGGYKSTRCALCSSKYGVETVSGGPYPTEAECLGKKADDETEVYCRCDSFGTAGATPVCNKSTKKAGCTASSPMHGGTTVCYGTVYDTETACKSAPAGPPPSTPAPTSEPISVSADTEKINIGTLRAINPLTRSTVFSDPSSRNPGNFVSRLVKNIVFPSAGLLLFLYLVWGGFQIVQGGSLGKDNLVDAGKQRATAAVIGFLVLFGSYWLWSLVELALGLGAA